MSSQGTLATFKAKVLHEPVTGVFNTQHSILRNKVIAEQGLILLAEVGSTMHGVSTDSNEDDIDELGVCIEPPYIALGLTHFEQYEYRTQAVNERSGPGDIDRTIYGLRKFVKLATAGNPTVLMPLFADMRQHVRYASWAGVELRNNRDMFITKSAGRKFLGYLSGQRERYLDPSRQDSKHASRPELIEQYGWDTKTGYHALRLAIQGKELMDTGTITLPMLDVCRNHLLKVRNGEFTEEQVTESLDNWYIPQLEHAVAHNVWPDKPNMERINNWLASAYTGWWKQKGLI